MLAVVATMVVGVVISVMAAAWVAGLARVSTLDVYTEIEISAPKEIVWAIISDFDKYADWNPLMVEARGKPEVGQRMDWTSRIAGADRLYNARVDAVAPARELTWIGPVGSVGRIGFWGRHSLVIEELGPDRVKLINKERFGGLMTFVYGGFLKTGVPAAYDRMNAAVKARAEQMARDA